MNLKGMTKHSSPRTWNLCGCCGKWSTDCKCHETPHTCAKADVSKEVCSECNGKGTLTQLGGDWGKTPETQVPCWKCKGKR